MHLRRTSSCARATSSNSSLLNVGGVRSSNLLFCNRTHLRVESLFDFLSVPAFLRCSSSRAAKGISSSPRLSRRRLIMSHFLEVFALDKTTVCMYCFPVLLGNMRLVGSVW